MDQGRGATTAYYVWIVYEPYTTLYKTETQKTTRCWYKELNAYCSIGKLSNSHANVLRRELSEQWHRITQPQSKRYTCHNTILLLQEPDAVLRWLGESSPFKHIPDEAIWQFKLSIAKQELGFEQCRALDNCISLVNAAKVLDGYKDGKVLTISEQSVQVDLRCWESVTTLKRLSRSVGIEPTNNDGWIDRFIKKLGFTSHIQNYEAVKTAVLDAKPRREKGKTKVKHHSSPSNPPESTAIVPPAVQKEKTPTVADKKHKALYEAVIADPEAPWSVIGSRVGKQFGIKIDAKAAARGAKLHVEKHPDLPPLPKRSPGWKPEKRID